MANRVMRLRNNPDQRGFLVVVLEETGRDDALGIINFKTIDKVACGTRRSADRAYDRLREAWGAR